MDRGFKKVRPLAGGLDAWVAAGFETHGAAPLHSTLPVRAVE